MKDFQDSITKMTMVLPFDDKSHLVRVRALSSVFPGVAVGDELRILSDRDNFRSPAEGNENEETSENLKAWRQAVAVAFSKAAVLAKLASPTADQSGAISCLEFKVFVRTTPSFKNLGIFTHDLKSASAKMFEDAPTPLGGAIGCVSLAAGAHFSIDADFLVNRA
jgi:hypothetical protein